MNHFSIEPIQVAHVQLGNQQRAPRPPSSIRIIKYALVATC